MIDVAPHDPSDPAALDGLIAKERDSRQRDRYRCARLALDGKSTAEIELATARGRTFVQKWAYRYRDGGVPALSPRKAAGRPTRLARDREQAFRARILAGPTSADGGVCVLRGGDARRILEAEFGAEYSLQGVYDLMHRLNLSCLRPRPRHRKNDPAAMAAWLERAPFLSAGPATGTPARRWRSGSRTRPASVSRGR
jgi:transposase